MFLLILRGLIAFIILEVFLRFLVLMELIILLSGEAKLPCGFYLNNSSFSNYVFILLQKIIIVLIG